MMVGKGVPCRSNHMRPKAFVGVVCFDMSRCIVDIHLKGIGGGPPERRDT